jgi:hypothetical protein
MCNRAIRFTLQIKKLALLKGTGIEEYSKLEYYSSRANIFLRGKNISSVFQKHKQGSCKFLQLGHVYI